MSFFNEIADMLGCGEARVALGYNYVNYNGEAVYIEGAKGILKLSDGEIVLRINKGVLYVYGSNLLLSDLASGAALIKGAITAVSTAAKDGAK